MVLLLFFFLFFSSASGNTATHDETVRKNAKERLVFNADALIPGQTLEKDLNVLVGSPLRQIKEKGQNIYFYDVGPLGGSMTATVGLRSDGAEKDKKVVAWVLYFCDETIEQVKRKFPDAPESLLALSGLDKISAKGGQRRIMLDSEGRGFVFSARTGRARLCMKWKPGTKFYGEE